MTEFLSEMNIFAEHKKRCLRILHALIATMVFAATATASAQPSNEPVDFEIPQQAISSAMISFSEQANMQIIVDATLVAGLQTAGIRGSMRPEAALEAILDQTDLKYEFSSPRTITILPMVSAITADRDTGSEESRGVGIQQSDDDDTNSDTDTGGESSSQNDISNGTIGVLEEVFVTAQKRKESLQKTALSIVAFSSEQLERSSIVDIYDLGIQTPGMIVNSEIVGKIYIRGIGAENLTIGGDPGVAVHTDGAYIARTSAAIFDLYDVERVEVLRGPQGTLYGRNATGGSINILSKAPTEEFEGSFSAEFGNYEKTRIGGMLSGPLAEDRVLARAAFVKSDRDGFTPNLFTGEDLDDEDLFMGRVRFRFLVNDDVTIDLIADVVNDDSSPAPFKQLEFSPLFEGALGANDPPDLREVAQESPVTQSQDQWGITGIFNWAMEDYTFTSVSSYRDTQFEAVFDGDAVDITFQNFENFDDTHQFSQEFRLASTTATKWDWIVGAYYFNDKGDTRIFIPIPGFGFDILHLATLSTDAFALFGQATYHVSDQLALTVGLRYNSEDKEAQQFTHFIGLFPPFNQDLNENSDELTPKFGLEYIVNEDILVYANMTRGFKSGGFTFNGFQSNFDPEFVWAYETGLKSRLANGAVIFNVSAFYYDYTDLQVSKLENNAGVITNAADATIYGGEIELIALPTDNLRLNVGLSFLNAEFDEFLTEDPSNPQLGTINLSGNSLPRSPDFSANVGAEYYVPLNLDGGLTFRVDYQYQDKSFFTTFNRDLSAQESFSLLNARLGYETADKSWRVALYAKNLLDEDYFLNILESGVEAGKPEGFLAAPRTYGLQFSYNF